MHIDETSFGQRYGNVRYEDYIPGLFHQIKVWKTSEYYTQLVSISSNPWVFLDYVGHELGNYIFVIVREDKRLFQVRKDGSKVQLWSQENGQVPIEILLENHRNQIR